MNERITELAEQAFQPINDISTEGVADRYTFEQAWFQMYNQKFAELIVEECRNVLSDEYRKTPLECCGHFLRADEAMAKHFYGVSE